MRFVALLVVVGCTPAITPRAPDRVTQPVTSATPSYQLPVLGKVPPSHLQCDIAQDSTRRHRVYDFLPIAIEPIRFGPRARERDRSGHPRAIRQVASLIATRFDGIEACWKWAAARGTTPAPATLAFTIDPAGRARDVDVTMRAADFGACVAEQLDGAAIEITAARPIRVTLPLRLELADQPAWRTRPARPARPAPSTIHTCGVVVDDNIVEHLDSLVPLVLSDFDTARNAPSSPRVVFACTDISWALDKAHVKQAIMSNLGAFDTCYASALEVDPQLVGSPTISMAFTDAGTVRDVHASGDGDDRFHHCLEMAARDIWMEPAGGQITVNLPFTLVPKAESLADPADLARFAQALRDPATTDRCGMYAGIVSELVATVAPWLDDDRVRHAIRDLVRVAGALPAAEATACLDSVETVLRAFALPERGGPYAEPWQWFDRVELVQPILDRTSFAFEARVFYARQLLPTTRRREGVAILEALRAPPTLSPKRRTELTDLIEGATRTSITRCGLVN